MDSSAMMLWQVAACVAMLAAVLVGIWRGKEPTAGLPAAYLVSLAMIHWVGAYIHTLPWFINNDSLTVARGFEPCFAGVMAFSAGTLLVGPPIARALPFGRVSTPIQPNPRLPVIYILSGILCFTVLAPVLGKIPSISAMINCGVYLVVIGFCLACWKAHQEGKRWQLFFWLAAVTGIPIVTAVSMGFIGYGAVAGMMVYLFVFSFHRPRWQSVLALVVMFFAGLSIYVTYMRDRSSFREVVWGEQGLQNRLEAMRDTFESFEVINFGNDAHLQLIDLRLNQNALIGLATDNLDARVVPYANGVTLWWAVLSMVPRIVWPSKPATGGGLGVASYFTGLSFEGETSVGVGHIMEFYVNFGTIGVVIGLFVLGTVARIVDIIAGRHLQSGNWPGFTAWFLPALSMLNTGGSLMEMTGTTVASLVLVLLLNRFLFPMLHILPRSSPAEFKEVSRPFRVRERLEA
jgi:hypothetical protein